MAARFGRWREGDTISRLASARKRLSTLLPQRVSSALAWIASLTILAALALPVPHLPLAALGCAIAFTVAFPPASWDAVDLAALALAAAWLVSALLSPLRVDAAPTLTCLALGWGVARIRDRHVALTLVAGVVALGTLVLTQLAVLSAQALLSGAGRTGVFMALAEWGGYPELGFLGVIILPLLMGIGLHAASLSVALASAVVVTAAGAGVLLSISRASWLACGAATALLLATARARRAIPTVLVLISLLGLAWARVPIVSTYGSVLLTGDGTAAVTGRTQAWRMAAAVWRERWIVGWGPGVYRQAFAARFPTSTEFATVHAHNELLQIAVETGIVGVATALSLAGAVLVVACRGLRSRSGPLRGVRTGIMASLVGVAVRFQFDYFDPASGPQRVMIVLSMVAGLAVALGRLERRREATAAEGTARV